LTRRIAPAQPFYAISVLLNRIFPFLSYKNLLLKGKLLAKSKNTVNLQISGADWDGGIEFHGN